MITVHLTPDQIEGVAKPIQRRADARVARADARTAEWKQQYSEARKSLIAARSEINELKRRLRNGDFE